MAMNFSRPRGNLPFGPRMRVTPEQLYEQTLVVRSQMGDEPAFRELLGLHGPRVLRFIQTMMQTSPELIADLAQEIWIAIFRALPGLHDAGKFRPWAFRIARDRIYREYRRRKLPLQPIEETHLDELPAVEEPESPADLEELQRCLDTLSPEHREVLLLRFFEDMTYDQIAHLTGSSVGTVRSRLHYGKRALKGAWKTNTP